MLDSLIADSLNRNELIALAVIAFLCVLALYYGLKKLAINRQQRKVTRVIRRISDSFLKNVTLDMGVDQYAYFDYILLNRDGILVLEIKDYAGHIFGSEQINEWTQVIDGKSYKFPNPFFDLERKIELLHQLTNRHVIDALVLFTDHADFPKGRPARVKLLHELRAQYGKSKRADIADSDRQVWQQLKDYFGSVAKG